MLIRIICNDREEWLIKRQEIGIGASEAAAVVGLSPWTTTTQLWQIKTGMKQATDLSGKPEVERGKKLEAALRGLFAAEHPELLVDYREFDILYQSERPWLFATLDGELFKEDGTKGILEIKTSAPNGKEGWKKWSGGNVPDYYYIQLLHQLLATGYDFSRLYGYLECRNGDKILREYSLERPEVKDDMAWLLEREEAFMQSVRNRTLPPIVLSFK